MYAPPNSGHRVFNRAGTMGICRIPHRGTSPSFLIMQMSQALRQHSCKPWGRRIPYLE
ncbi:hypothetical protein B0O80DRAFT_466610 [Mortierella sp. GBAus27b]|nr:hypothetical protein B0O80DRAFT_466610 [Mortierella sp. GBAus27b]